MELKKVSEHLNGIVVMMPEVFQDERGFFLESYRADQFKTMDLDLHFVQENHSGYYAYLSVGLREY